MPEPAAAAREAEPKAAFEAEATARLRTVMLSKTVVPLALQPAGPES